MKLTYLVITFFAGLVSIIISLIVNHVMITVLLGIIGGFLITLPVFIYVVGKDL